MRLAFLSGLVVLAAAAGARGGEAMLEKSDLFDAGTGGYALYRIPGIVVSARGTLLAYCEARKAGGGDWGQIDLMLRRRQAGGTWEPARRIVAPPTDVPKNPAAVKQKLGLGQVTLNNPVAIAARNGTVHFLYCAEYSRCYYMRSEDDGRSFSKPVDITPTFEKFRPEYDWQVLATGPGHGIELSNGRLVVPVWLSTGTGGHAHRPSCVSVIYSDDGGQSWQRGQIVVSNPNPANPSESMAVELNDGRVMLNIRHESRPRLRGMSLSADGARNWSPIRFEEQLPDPVCMASLVRWAGPAAEGKGWLIFSNPHNAQSTERKNLTIKLSEDEGKTWAVARTLEAGPSGYSDLAVGPEGTIYCFYERGAMGGSAARSSHLCLARFNLQWLKQAKP